MYKDMKEKETKMRSVVLVPAEMGAGIPERSST